MLALEDITVVSLESGISAPLCTRLLGDFGAEVIKVERPGVGDVNRHWDTAVYGDSSAHVWVDRNKLSVELNLKADAGRAVFRELAAEADVIVQNYSPGVVERLGVGYEDVTEYNDDVIYLNISGYGRDGPYEDRKAYDMVMQGETGLIPMNGSPDAPAKIPLSICDINAATYGTISTLLALFHRERTGEGQELDVTMFGGILSWLGYFPHKYWHTDEIPERIGMRHHLLTPYGPHETADDQSVNFAILSEAHWELLCTDVLERPDLLEDERFETNEKRVENRGMLEPLIEDLIADYPRDYWAERLAEAGIPWGDVNELDDVLDHPQADHLDLVKEFETEDGPVPYVDTPIDSSELEFAAEPMPDLGEDTEDVLAALGYSSAEIEELRDADVI
ncbi:bile acid-inducible L-carnitine dehydratase protein F [Natrinema pellirubrum DSM 15624]|uniref:Acyl-CoA transferase/carnitine dehydratase n=1 Tax=Natrinema pellirubrum (strain DSM 15624 / CIP 106293 / JCM 10476 / NCIMB 786 / 157) TaxID=797303 RepID=L0JLK9_NATP1|nr:CaiB/BaiF CoA-transferase family protein [Natrinema pellirubrum]AGB31241.1 putative acyl-CoA transferase/carnitine dehydratase [Natrinema pellirubrum DSM 15624]ELY81824.1 bile acid-inducible L-carnitine dehydratase protein F [Natrinema pellirubrum DSM 15624]